MSEICSRCGGSGRLYKGYSDGEGRECPACKSEGEMTDKAEAVGELKCRMSLCKGYSPFRDSCCIRYLDVQLCYYYSRIFDDRPTPPESEGAVELMKKHLSECTKFGPKCYTCKVCQWIEDAIAKLEGNDNG